jgi:hypothetical protein
MQKKETRMMNGMVNADDQWCSLTEEMTVVKGLFRLYDFGFWPASLTLSPSLIFVT